MCEVYISSDTDSPHTVNLPKQVERIIIETVKSGKIENRRIFDVASEYTLQLMYENVYLNYRTTDFFLGWLHEVNGIEAQDLREQWYKNNKRLIKAGQLMVKPAPLLQLKEDESMKSVRTRTEGST
eukprot:TRINITY_DN14720_c0_g1_i1.p1 TRINITY_DN14720_c0_g1~~TRINITY_DN14720_c0_g1_i1.p1  ORF type:complete len:126 (-),score=22.79 TRINITY_DN14720_c0_g1_i1:143-520(-)